VASVENPAAQAPLAAKLYFDCHDAVCTENLIRIDCVTESPKRQRR
jgi:hypothetical protein